MAINTKLDKQFASSPAKRVWNEFNFVTTSWHQQCLATTHCVVQHVCLANHSLATTATTHAERSEAFSDVATSPHVLR